MLMRNGLDALEASKKELIKKYKVDIEIF